MTLPVLPPRPIEAIELVRVSMPLVRPFRTSFGTQTERDVLLVRVITPDAEGWGECVTTSAPLYSSEYTDAAAHVLAQHLGPRVLGEERVSASTLGGIVGDVVGHRMAKSALETALLDAQLRGDGRSLASFVGAARDRVPCGVSIGIPAGGTGALVEQVQEHLGQGYRRIKVKIEPGFDVEPVTAVREACGDDLALQVDANTAYRLQDLPTLQALDELGLQLIEQPFHEDRLLDHATLAGRLRTPICLDESIVDADSAIDAIALGATSIVNVKVGRVGGILEAVRVHDVCAERQVPVWCGGMLETGIGRAVNVAVAAMSNMRLPGDTSASSRYFAQDLTEPFELEDGHLAVPDGPGIGRAPLPDVLAERETSRTGLTR